MRISDWSSDVCSSDLDQRHQRFSDIAAAEGAEMAARIRLIAQAVRSRGGLGAEAVGTVGHRPAALRKAAILSTSLTPGALSTPVETSTSGAPVAAIAAATLAGSKSAERRVGHECVRQCRFRGA